MATLFNFKHLNVSLIKKTKTMQIEIIYQNDDCYLSGDHILELEQIVDWSASHIEINSIVLCSASQELGKGLDPALLSRLDGPMLQTLLNRFQKLVYGIFFLPQTTIIDMGAGAQGIMTELSIPFDYRICSENASIRFNHLENGRIPSCGGIGFLNSLIPHSFVKKWITTGTHISIEELTNSGFIHQISDFIEPHLLETINSQSPTARMQAKRSLLESILPELDRALEYEKRFAFANLISGDWRSDGPFKNPKDLSKELKELQAEQKDNVVRLNEFRQNH